MYYRIILTKYFQIIFILISFISFILINILLINILYLYNKYLGLKPGKKIGRFIHNELITVKRFNGDEVQSKCWSSAAKMDDRGRAFPRIRV